MSNSARDFSSDKRQKEASSLDSRQGILKNRFQHQPKASLTNTAFNNTTINNGDTFDSRVSQPSNISQNQIKKSFDLQTSNQKLIQSQRAKTQMTNNSIERAQ